jgi:hypothetical protein
MVIEVSGGYEILEEESELSSNLDHQTEDVCIISGTITISL